MGRTRYYVGQYGYFWSFSKRDLIAFFENALTAGGYEDIPGKEVGQPAGILRSDTGGYWSSLPGASGRFYQPLDWKEADFREALNELREG